MTKLDALTEYVEQPWLADPHAAPRAELTPEQKGPQEVVRTTVKITRRFDWSELFEKVCGWWR